MWSNEKSIRFTAVSSDHPCCSTSNARIASLLPGPSTIVLAPVYIIIMVGTTILTIYKETRSYKWAAMSVVITLGMAFLVTFITASLARLIAHLV